MNEYFCVCSTFDDRGRVTANIINVIEAAEMPESSYKETWSKDVYFDWYSSRVEAERAVADARKA